MIVLLKLQGDIPPSRKQDNVHMAWNPLGYILEVRTNSTALLNQQGWRASATAIFGQGVGRVCACVYMHVCVHMCICLRAFVCLGD